MSTRPIEIKPYAPAYRADVIGLALRAWAPVFSRTEHEVPRFVFDAFYPGGWVQRQEADVARILDDEGEHVWLAQTADELIGFIGLRIHPEDQMGEIHILAVDPVHQRQGVSRALMEFAERNIRDAGMTMVMVETIDDSGHEPARRAYEVSGYERWPVARYFKRL